jgi:beta-lysine N6-acetyltransferase
MDYDRCETLGHSAIQHGPQSDRVYLMKLDRRDLPEITGLLDAIAERNGYSKIFAKIPEDAVTAFTEHDYRQEAHIPGFYHGEKDALFLGKFLDPARAEPKEPEVLEEVIALAKSKAAKRLEEFVLPEGMRLIACAPDHAEEMSRIYQEVFPTYPFPIHEPAYLQETMASHIDYFGVLEDDRLIALSSAEKDLKGANVEMTDFATLPSYRGRGLARCLLQAMESAMLKRKMCTAYTIARAVSPGMNITFAQMGYQFSGTLVNNTQISGSVESMNIWYKSLAQGA